MEPARGDSKPCSHAACSGTMQFGREPQLQVHPTMTLNAELGWVCSKDPLHFQLGSGSRPQTATITGPRARWDDDGGATLREQMNDPRR